MFNYDETTYGDKLASTYDTWFDQIAVSDEQLTMLASMAGGRPVVEIGAGTGRVAIPLARAGVPVIGIDASSKMIDRIIEKSVGLPVSPQLGSAATFSLADKTNLIYCILNTFFQFSSADQAKSLENARKYLTGQGRVVLETEMPLLPDGPDELKLKEITADRVVLSARRNDADRHVLEVVDIVMESGLPPQLYPTQSHYLTPPELDALAADNGFRLVARYADWQKSAFTDSCRRSVSIYQCA